MRDVIPFYFNAKLISPSDQGFFEKSELNKDNMQDYIKPIIQLAKIANEANIESRYIGQIKMHLIAKTFSHFSCSTLNISTILIAMFKST
mgnify:CR=1 FL=1